MQGRQAAEGSSVLSFPPDRKDGGGSARVRQDELLLDEDFGQFPAGDAMLCHGYHGTVLREGSGRICLQGKLPRDRFLPVLLWGRTLILAKGSAARFWPVYAAGGTVEVRFHIYIRDMESNRVVGQRILEGEDLDQPAVLKAESGSDFTGFTFVLEAKAAGQAQRGKTEEQQGETEEQKGETEEQRGETEEQLVAGEKGTITVDSLNFHREGSAISSGTGGGKSSAGKYRAADFPASGRNTAESGRGRITDAERNEVPWISGKGDGKAPLLVCFAGTEPTSMKAALSLVTEEKAPFLLLADPRFDGAGFWMGTRVHEEAVLQFLTAEMEKRGFTREQTVFLGMAAGAEGALSYGAMIRPAAVLLGQPVLNPGAAALQARFGSSGDMPEAPDILLCMKDILYQGQTAKERDGIPVETAAKELDHRLWRRIREADWSGSEIAVIYRREDNPELTGYRGLLELAKEKNIRLYGKEISGGSTAAGTEQDGIRRWLSYRCHAIVHRMREEKS